jgi:transcriptional regulator with XRE-family HTH domain
MARKIRDFDDTDPGFETDDDGPLPPEPEGKTRRQKSSGPRNEWLRAQLVAARVASKLSQADLARAMNVPRNDVWRVESGNEKFITLDTAEAWLAACGSSLPSLLGDEDDATVDPHMPEHQRALLRLFLAALPSIGAEEAGAVKQFLIRFIPANVRKLLD